MADYPGPPWHMRGQMWTTTLRVATTVDELRPAGLYNVAFVDYGAGSPLQYRELMVGRRIRAGEYAGYSTITDIWVDSPLSLEGGRAIWAVPKQLCDFSITKATTGPRAKTDCSASIDGKRFVTASFTDFTRLVPRLPIRSAKTYQPGLPEGDGEKIGTMSARARFLPCRANWQFATDGPLGWLSGAQQVYAVRARNFRMQMGVSG